MTDLLRRLQGAIPRVERWIDDLHTSHRGESVRTSDLKFRRLAAHFPASLLTSTSVALVPKVPFPPVSEYGLREFEAMANMPMAGITFRNMYFVQPSSSSESVHFHELVHVVQWARLGVRDFLLTYALGIVLHGYAESPLEAIAYELQRQFERKTPMGSVVDRIDRHACETRERAASVFTAHGFRLGV
jgi:hypothetical protein